MNRQIGPYFKIWIQDPGINKLPNFSVPLSLDAGIHGPPNRSVFLNSDAGNSWTASYNFIIWFQGFMDTSAFRSILRVRP